MNKKKSMLPSKFSFSSHNCIKEDENREACPRCGSLNLIQSTNLPGIHWGEVRCSDCGRHLKWLPSPKIEEAHQKRILLIDSLLPVTKGWENFYLKNIRDIRKLSPKQQEKLDQIANRHAQGGAA
ncbi:hypothetical protein [Fischerella thermalis]|uniref:Uncharacterized protein n=1 Tax=Fischerella thermalis CCMEE 5318 TaxID=2019666 RepID=A0A2N6LPL2_9CYAN|nr:hypothetical protein [Fischerella thermalis]PMB27799.1 hypothetical protein CEN46_00680 [Fischerella thermalis CCMEE 5318]